MTRAKALSLVVAVFGALLVLSGCASLSMTAEELDRALEGSEATFCTYDKTGNVMDDVSDTSIRVTRDETFDEFNGESTDKGSVVLVQVGKQEIRHVGSTATLIEDGIEVIIPAQQGQAIESTEDAVPFIQKIIAGHENAWRGSAKAVLVRTQDDVPVAVFSGDEVELFKPGDRNPARSAPADRAHWDLRNPAAQLPMFRRGLDHAPGH
ncbi:DUF5052 family protein [Saccharopolyspora shandongensis]|uniref:DUF5052 family protein n=1 Tax=Saccharopolyspora shandongensis TaxID=418495 RepID=UPI00340A0C1F